MYDEIYPNKQLFGPGFRAFLGSSWILAYELKLENPRLCIVMSFSPPKEDNKDLKYNSYKSFIVLTGRFSFFQPVSKMD